MKVRIGNDIKFIVLLNSEKINTINIKQAKAILVNTTGTSFCNSKYACRFPKEPCDCYKPTPYNLNCSGCYGYNVLPHNNFLRRYHGFGYHPNWDEIYPQCEAQSHKYIALVKHTVDNDKIEVYFPAEAQVSTGEYKLIIMAKLYEPGYRDDNTRVITVDYNDVVTLVSSSEEGVDGPVSILVDGASPVTTPVNDNYVVSGYYELDHITLNMNNGANINIDMTNEQDWPWEEVG